MTMADVTVDASGLRCPMPLLMAKRALNGMQPGQVLQVLATDAASAGDFATFSEQSGHPLLLSEESAGTWTIELRKA
jgi:TusA-related sulfurtransferase